jgi:hypothetical protein
MENKKRYGDIAYLHRSAHTLIKKEKLSRELPSVPVVTESERISIKKENYNSLERKKCDVGNGNNRHLFITEISF